MFCYFYKNADFGYKSSLFRQKLIEKYKKFKAVFSNDLFVLIMRQCFFQIKINFTEDKDGQNIFQNESM